MPAPFMCHDCDGYTMNSHGVCDNCIEPTTADEFNKEIFMKDASPHDPGDENDNKEIAYLEGEKNPLKAIEDIENKYFELKAKHDELIKDLRDVCYQRDDYGKALHTVKELAMLRDNYGMIESIAEEALKKND